MQKMVGIKKNILASRKNTEPHSKTKESHMLCYYQYNVKILLLEVVKSCLARAS